MHETRDGSDCDASVANVDGDGALLGGLCERELGDYRARSWLVLWRVGMGQARTTSGTRAAFRHEHSTYRA